jgi:hypothetical protein
MNETRLFFLLRRALRCVRNLLAVTVQSNVAITVKSPQSRGGAAIRIGPSNGVSNDLTPFARDAAKPVPARIVNVSSAGQQPIHFDDVMLIGGYSGALSKQADSGHVHDRPSRCAPGYQCSRSRVFTPATHMDTSTGAAGWSEAIEHGQRRRAAILNLATSRAVAGRTGLYFNGLREARAHA